MTIDKLVKKAKVKDKHSLPDQKIYKIDDAFYQKVTMYQPDDNKYKSSAVSECGNCG